MNAPSASFSVTMRVVLNDARTISAITSVITDGGGGVIALDVVDSHADELVFHPAAGRNVTIKRNAVIRGPRRTQGRLRRTADVRPLVGAENAIRGLRPAL